MHRLMAGLFLAATFVIVGGSPRCLAGDPPAARIDPNFAPLGQPAPGVVQAFPSLVPGNPNVYQRQVPQGNAVVCDQYGRCWQQVPVYRAPSYGGQGYFGRRPPGWADDDVPRHDPYGFKRPHSAVACNPSLGACYPLG